MNDWKEKALQEKIETLKNSLGDTKAKPKEINNAWAEVMGINPGYNSTLFNGLLESFRLCVTQGSGARENSTRVKIARDIWGFIKDDYLKASDQIVSERQCIEDFSIAIKIPCLTIAKKMGENGKFKTAIFKLERECEDKPQKKALLRSVVFASDQGPIIDDFVYAMQDNSLLEELINELKKDQKEKNVVYSLGKMKLLEKLLLKGKKQSSYVVTQELLLSRRKRKYEPVQNISSNESVNSFPDKQEIFTGFGYVSAEQEKQNSFGEVNFWQKNINGEIDYNQIDYDEVAKFLDSFITQ